MWAKLLKQEFFRHRQELLTTPVPRCGRTNPTITRVIFGPWAVSFTSSLHSTRLLQPRIWKVSTIEFSRVYIPRYRTTIRVISMLYWKACCKSTPRRDQRLIRSYTCLSLRRSTTSSRVSSRGSQPMSSTSTCWGRSDYLEMVICRVLWATCLRVNTILTKKAGLRRNRFHRLAHRSRRHGI